jgi:hypothetical protein
MGVLGCKESHAQPVITEQSAPSWKPSKVTVGAAFAGRPGKQNKNAKTIANDRKQETVRTPVVREEKIPDSITMCLLMSSLTDLANAAPTPRSQRPPTPDLGGSERLLARTN